MNSFWNIAAKGKVAKLLHAAGYRTRGGVICGTPNFTALSSSRAPKGVYYFKSLPARRYAKRIPKPKANGQGPNASDHFRISGLRSIKSWKNQLKGWKRPGKGSGAVVWQPRSLRLWQQDVCPN